MLLIISKGKDDCFGNDAHNGGEHIAQPNK